MCMIKYKQTLRLFSMSDDAQSSLENKSKQELKVKDKIHVFILFVLLMMYSDLECQERCL